MKWEDVPVLVTGAAGFIGSHLVERLAAEGAQVRAFVRYTSRSDDGLLVFLPTDLLRQVTIIRGDLRDESAVAAAMEGIHFVFHLGALISIPYSYQHPREVAETNVMGTLNVLEAARRTKPRRIVHTSSSEVYGTALRAPISESHPLQGQSPYAATKIGADKLAESYCRAFDIPVVTIRPFNTYGPRQSTRAVIPTIVTQALSGSEVRLGALTPTRDFTFIDDTVRGLLSGASASDSTLGMEINLGTGEDTAIEKLAKMIGDLIGRDLQIVCEHQRLRPPKSEVDRLLADNDRASELLNWSPKIGLEEGLRLTIEWIRTHLDLFRTGEYKT